MASANSATERRNAEIVLSAAFAASHVGVAVTDLHGRATVVNPAAAALLGRPPSDLLGHDWTRYLHPEETRFRSPVLAENRRPGHGRPWERRFLRPSGEVVWLQVDWTVVTGEDGEPLYGIMQVQDVTARRAAEDGLFRRALFDELTGVANRALLEDRLERALSATQRSPGGVGVIVVDIDDFGHFNQALGRGVGDRLLVEVARRLSGAVRPVDTVARTAGDRFVVVCQKVSPEGMAAVADRLEGEMGRLFDIDGARVGVSVTLGVSVSGIRTTCRSLLGEAEEAMRRAKGLRLVRTGFYDDSLRANAVVTSAGEALLRTAVARREIEPYFQRVVDLRTGQAVGVEALARWHSPDMGEITPAAFLPLAESTGLIVQMGEDILARAAAEVAYWNLGRTDPLWVGVNLSAAQLADPGLADAVVGVLGDTGLSAPLLHLEITESALAADPARSLVALGRLKEIGVTLAIDDFGTGLNSLTFLRQLPVDFLKIAPVFVEEMEATPDGAATVSAVLALAGAMRMECVAEGVETVRQSAGLEALGCQYGQGFLWGGALPPPDAAAWALDLST